MSGSCACPGTARERSTRRRSFLICQRWQRIQFSELRSRRYRAGLKNQMISRVVNQASKTPRIIETIASTIGIQRTSAVAGCPQYGVLIEGWRVIVIRQSRTGLILSLGASTSGWYLTADFEASEASRRCSCASRSAAEMSREGSVIDWRFLKRRRRA